MGIAVSTWRLARAVSLEGQLGVVSGPALDFLLVRRLRLGDPGGHYRRALEHFPVPAIAKAILEKPAYSMRGDPELTAAAVFAEIRLAKEGHDGIVGLNLLEKIQLPTLPALYGALLAGVDCVIMGAGIPREIPAVLDALAEHREVSLKLHIEGEERLTFRPFAGGAPLRRPPFFAIVASNALATMMVRKAKVDGLVIEGPTAGGHNAPPRSGETVYGPRDVVDLEALAKLGVPFWLAGSYGHASKLREARAAGAAGIQVGTAFAFCRESGLSDELKRAVLARVRRGDARVETDFVASPTGFPFKVVTLDGTVSDPAVYAARERRCDVGLLRQAYRRADGTIGWRCPAEPVDTYVGKGGREEDTAGCKCLCNGLIAAAGLNPEEPAIVTCGDDLPSIARFGDSYSAADVIRDLLEAEEAEGAEGNGGSGEEKTELRSCGEEPFHS